MNKNLCLIFTLMAVVMLHAQNPLINNPSLNHDGTKMAFNYQGDIWIAHSDGSDSRRITVHEANDTNPLWTADGKSIVFQSNRFGNYDLYIMPALGGKPKRLTYHSANDYVTSVAKDGEILFETKRNFSQIERDLEIQTISSQGGTPKLKLHALGSDAVLSPNKKLIAFVRGTCRIEREAYTGSANRDIWVYNIAEDRYHQLTNFNGNDYLPKWGDDETLYFLSSRSGRYNIHKATIEQTGKGIIQKEPLTHFDKMGVYGYDVSRNNHKIVLLQGDQLFSLNHDSLKPISLNIHADYGLDPVVHKTYTNEVKTVVPSPNGKLSAIVIRGEIFVKENNKEKSRTVNVSESAYRDRMPQWLDDHTLIFISDRHGQNDIYAVQSADVKEKNLFKTLKRKIIRLTNTEENETNLKISPDAKSLVFERGKGQLMKVSINGTSISNEKVLLSGWDSPSGISWSPDSQWIAYSLSDLEFNDEVYILKTDGVSQPVNISMHPKRDSRPVWSKDGSKIAFSSNRNNSDYDVWFTWLKIEDWQKTKEDWDELEDDEANSKENKKKVEQSKEKKKKKDKSKSNDKKSVKPIQIDIKDIHQRQKQVTSITGGEFVQGFSKDGKTIYYTTGDGSRGNSKTTSDLYKIKWDGKDQKSLTKNGVNPRNISFDHQTKFVYYTSKGKISRIDLKNDKSESLPIKAKLDIDYKEEANQIFEEAWLAINNGFYDPDFHGQDWQVLKNTYKPLAMKASSRNDFKMVFNRMLGQINASHMGMYRGEDRTVTQKETTGLIGVYVEPVSEGVKVERVVYGMPAQRKVSTLKKGDVINAVNGVKINEQINFYKLLNGTSNEKIYLNVTAIDGAKKEVVIRPKSNQRKENYLDWVKQKKELTKKYSNGKLGYIHIQGMNWTSFEAFERELTAEGMGKEGVVIDVRFNGGGWTTDYLMAVLTVKQHAYTIPRGAAKDLKTEHTKFLNQYPYNERLPLTAWTKPSIALCNANSYSNAEIFSHAYKNLGLGTLVGVPTFGAVISTGATGLIDGSIVRMPFRGWYAKKTKKNMEFEAAIPNIIVKNQPDAKYKAEDQQLKRAVEELLKQTGS